MVLWVDYGLGDLYTVKDTGHRFWMHIYVLYMMGGRLTSYQISELKSLQNICLKSGISSVNLEGIKYMCITHPNQRVKITL